MPKNVITAPPTNVSHTNQPTPGSMTATERTPGRHQQGDRAALRVRGAEDRRPRHEAATRRESHNLAISNTNAATKMMANPPKKATTARTMSAAEGRESPVLRSDLRIDRPLRVNPTSAGANR